ncbi:MAG TPA: histidine kinase [Thermoanaerobaculia bacterium]|jgi:signal transduction histidine kinase
MHLPRPLLAVLIVTFVGLLNFSIVETSMMAEGSRMLAKYPFVWEMTGAWTFLVPLPLLIFVIERYPIERRKLVRRLGLHIVIFLGYAITHTLLMWGSREVIYAILGWGWYDYGAMPYRFFMEGQKQLIIYVLLYGSLRFWAFVRGKASLERELTEMRLAALKSQLQPHFLFNALNMIASHVQSDPATAGAMLQHLSDFLRATLRASSRHEVPLSEEIAFLDSYLAIMKARFEERLQVAISVPPAVASTLVPHLLLQPLLENSVTHSLSDPMKRAEIRIDARRDGEFLRVTIEDNGPGIGSEILPSGNGIGLSNTIARLRHLYGDEQRLSIANRPEGGLRLVIELPWHTGAAA